LQKIENIPYLLTNKFLYNTLKNDFNCQLNIEINQNSSGKSIDCEKVIDSFENQIRFKEGHSSEWEEMCFILNFNDEKMLENKLILTDNDHFIEYSIDLSDQYFSLTSDICSELSGKLSESDERTKIYYDRGTTITSITRTSQMFLESPYKSRCSRYEKDMPYNSNSFEDCLRKCFIKSCHQLNQCFIWNCKGMITESDFKLTNYSVFCNETQNNHCRREINQTICEKLCPIDCIKDEYEIMSTFRIN